TSTRQRSLEESRPCFFRTLGVICSGPAPQSPWSSKKGHTGRKPCSSLKRTWAGSLPKLTSEGIPHEILPSSYIVAVHSGLIVVFPVPNGELSFGPHEKASSGTGEPPRRAMARGGSIQS